MITFKLLRQAAFTLSLISLFNFAAAAEETTAPRDLSAKAPDAHHSHTHAKKTVGETIDNSATSAPLPAGDSAYLDRLHEEKKSAATSFSLLAYRPSYLQPFYYTFSPDVGPYTGNLPTPTSKIRSLETRWQISFQIPLWENILGSKTNLRLGYTQVAFWQLYQKSPFFRETNYEPSLFVNRVMNDWFSLSAGYMHQSNGRGGTMERSWDRLYAEGVFSIDNWMVNFQPWVPVLPGDSMNLHNPDMPKYLGYGRTIVSYKYKENVFSVMTRNYVTSGFRRGAVELTWSYALNKHIKTYASFFSGYGQSLIEYNHYTNAVGLGFALTDWL